MSQQKEAKREPKGAKGRQKEAKGNPKGAKSEPKGDQNACKNRPSEKGVKMFGIFRFPGYLWEPFWLHVPSKNDEKIDANIDAEKVMEIEEKSMRKRYRF